MTGLLGTAAALPFAHMGRAQDSTDVELPENEAGTAFSFDLLADNMRAAAQKPIADAKPISGFLSGLDYDAYNRIRFNPSRNKWQDQPNFRMNAFHMGWLFKEPVHVFEVTNGRAMPMGFSAQDFVYDPKTEVPEDFEMPGVAGIRLMTPLNDPDRFDELGAFLGASYFRMLGEGNRYGLSARGLAVNTGLPQGEEFPRFSNLWLERPTDGEDRLTVYAALESKSVTGAYRFVITPGATTVMHVTARLFMREDVEQIGIAPLTSMYLYGASDPGNFRDFRESVHDSEALVINSSSGDTLFRPLNNPPRLANSYLGMENPKSFGLVQRTRGFDAYLDAEAHYELRPSVMVEPVGEWGRGTVRLMEIPTDLEVNDNIVAFWVPEADTKAGDEIELSYRLRWGMTPKGDRATDRARVLRTRVGQGGVAGVEKARDTTKFVIDFHGGVLSEQTDPKAVVPDVSISRGEITEAILSPIDNSDVWRLVVEARTDQGSVAELKARLLNDTETLTETWLYQWMTQ
ncbi:glucan biosynthesis protein [Sagittula sp. SSi028]|uniref:glucan biosynthesis protein n=1 Tax=Sagittula sp. SSi028 TaxID=3400636 RepID=UPI003AF9CF47